MGGILAGLFSSLLGGGLTAITGQIADAYKEHEAALTNDAKIEAQARIATLEAKRDVMIAESRSSPINAIVRAAFAIPVAAYYAKIFLWDKVLAWGTTDPLSDDLQWTARVVIGFYFLYEATRAVRGR